MSSDLQSLTSNDNVFQSSGAAQVSDLSPRVALHINADCLSKGLSLERLRLYSMTEASEMLVTPSKWELCHERS